MWKSPSKFPVDGAQPQMQKSGSIPKNPSGSKRQFGTVDKFPGPGVSGAGATKARSGKKKGDYTKNRKVSAAARSRMRNGAWSNTND